MILFVFGLFVGCGLGIFLISLLAKSKEADEVLLAEALIGRPSEGLKNKPKLNDKIPFQLPLKKEEAFPFGKVGWGG